MHIINYFQLFHFIYIKAVGKAIFSLLTCMRFGVIDDKCIILVTVYLKHIQFISTISEILPISCIYD